MSARIVLVRHGPSVHAQPVGALDRAAVERWREDHDAAGIQPACQPPVGLVRIAASATCIVSSDLPRAAESAERIGSGRPVRVSALLRETPLPVPRWPTRLPLRAWEALIHFRWMQRIVLAADVTENDRARAAAAADWIARLAADGGMVVAITHGVFRRILAKQLVTSGWSSAGRSGGYGHWSAWTFSAPAAPPGT